MYVELILCLRAMSATGIPFLRSAFSILRNCIRSFPVRRMRFPFVFSFDELRPFESVGRPRRGFGLSSISFSANAMMRRNFEMYLAYRANISSRVMDITKKTLGRNQTLLIPSGVRYRDLIKRVQAPRWQCPRSICARF